MASGVGSRFCAGWRGLSTERWQGWGPAALFVLEGPLAGPWAAGGSVGPGRSVLTSCLSVLWGAGASWGSGLAALGRLAALGGLEGGLGLRRASAAGPWASAGSGGGSGEAVGGELAGEAGELAVLPAGTCTRSVTVVTSRLVTAGGGSGTSACCSRSSGSGTCGAPTGCSPGSPGWLAGAQGRACKAEEPGTASCRPTCTGVGTGRLRAASGPPSPHLGVA